MSSAQLPAVSDLARYFGHTHGLCPSTEAVVRLVREQRAGPLAEIQRAHFEFYVRQLGERGLMDSSVVTRVRWVVDPGYRQSDGAARLDPLLTEGRPPTNRAEERGASPRPSAAFWRVRFQAAGSACARFRCISATVSAVKGPSAWRLG
jgi:integrase/recombinase XerD